ncbi:MAG: hypothetical protein M3R15_21245 [Acidobacteriota bacterium]|nr:hypothetical protein [Acidobacteriota bacterium]
MSNAHDSLSFKINDKMFDGTRVTDDGSRVRCVERLPGDGLAPQPCTDGRLSIVCCWLWEQREKVVRQHQHAHSKSNHATSAHSMMCDVTDAGTTFTAESQSLRGVYAES